MKPNRLDNQQGRLFKSRFSDELNPDYPLIQLSKLIEWKQFEEEFDKLFVEKIGQPAKPVKLVVGFLLPCNTCAGLQFRYN
ncbi:hypothetical protein [Neochlamydia sp. S13]|uniref:hypothetical protein n=1 Tax=Neochlamydia sp. S13 TaxID=1353976 RepID=UPI0005A8D647|nr:hypothetical protein [Neochlamydia sp. S13]BBI16968.1 Uncharacterized protein NCS13_1_0773 [Neochlamydia sp. S13]